jgi:hypothetical protein
MRPWHGRILRLPCIRKLDLSPVRLQHGEDYDRETSETGVRLEETEALSAG